MATHACPMWHSLGGSKEGREEEGGRDRWKERGLLNVKVEKGDMERAGIEGGGEGIFFFRYTKLYVNMF